MGPLRATVPISPLLVVQIRRMTPAEAAWSPSRNGVGAIKVSWQGALAG